MSKYYTTTLPTSRCGLTAKITTTLPTCRCGLTAKIITSWTNNNPGRRFAICSLYESGGCDFWAWVDAEMCSRSTEVIPGLLRRINKLEADVKCAENTLKELKTNNCNLLLELNTAKRRMRQILVMLIGWIIWVVTRAAFSSAEDN